MAFGLIATAIVGAFAAWPANAGTQYLIPESISAHLKKTTDDFGLCGRRGVSMYPLVVFQPKGSMGMGFYWDRPTDRFVQYPGTSGCMVWMRLG